MNLTCYAVDDESHSIEVIKNYIDRTHGLELIGSSTDPLVALNELTGEIIPAITFLDVDMPELSGMDLAGYINLYTTVVFTTSYPEYALEAFEKEALDFLIKPISYHRFLKCIQRIRKLATAKYIPLKRTREFFFVHTDTKGKLVKIMIDEIICVEGSKNYIKIFLINNRKIECYLTMGEIDAFLPKDKFSRIHKSFVINKERIVFLERNQVRMEEDINLSLGETFKESFFEQMSELVLKSKRKP